MFWGFTLLWKQELSVEKQGTHMSTPCECGLETVEWGSAVEMPVPNPANAPLRPLHTRPAILSPGHAWNPVRSLWKV